MCSKTCKNLMLFLTFRITRKRMYRYLLFQTRLLNTAANPSDPPDPGKMEHELRLATHQQCAGGKDDVSLNTLPQIMARISENTHACQSYVFGVCILSVVFRSTRVERPPKFELGCVGGCQPLIPVSGWEELSHKSLPAHG